MTKPTELPEWASSPQDPGDIATPSVSRKLSGWHRNGSVPEKPPYQLFNWWQNNVYQWISWLNGITGVGVVKQNADGVLVAAKIVNGDIDNLAGIALDKLAEHTIPATGAVAKSVASRINDAPYVTEFGAIGDGSTDCTAAFAAAILAYKCVRVPKGTFIISGLLNLTEEDALLCSDSGAIIISSAATTINLMGINSTVSGLTFKGAGTGPMISFPQTTAYGQQVIDCKFVGVALGVGLSNQRDEIKRVSNCRFDGCTTGIKYISGQYSAINDCNFYNCGIAIDNDNGPNFMIQDCAIVHCVAGIHIKGAPTGTSDHGRISGCTINHCQKYGIWLDVLHYSVNLLSNDIWATGTTSPSDLTFGDTAPFDSHFGLMLTDATNVNSVGNMFARNAVNVGLDGADHCSFEGCKFLTDAGKTTANLYFVGNGTDELGDGKSYNHHNIIVGNTFDGILSDGTYKKFKKYSGIVIDNRYHVCRNNTGEFYPTAVFFTGGEGDYEINGEHDHVTMTSSNTGITVGKEMFEQEFAVTFFATTIATSNQSLTFPSGTALFALNKSKFFSVTSNVVSVVEPCTLTFVPIDGDRFSIAVSSGRGLNYGIGNTSAPAFQNGWGNLGGVYELGSFCQDAAGVVHMHGMIAGGTMNAVIFTLPVGFRPELDTFVSTVASSSGGVVPATIRIYANGEVWAITGDNVWLSLQVSFPSA